MKKMLFIVSVLCIAAMMAGCKTKVLHCDHCDKEVVAKQDSNMEEDWIIYCDECNEDLFDDDPILGGD